MLLRPEDTRRLYEHAIAHGYAILAVNADSPAAVVDCLLAAKVPEPREPRVAPENGTKLTILHAREHFLRYLYGCH